MDQNLELAQATILGCIMADPEQAGPIFARIRIEDLDAQYRLIAEAIHGLRLAKSPYDALGVVDEMTRRGTIGRIGGMAEVYRVAGFSFGSPDYSVQIIARTARLRRLEASGVRTAANARIADADPLAVARLALEEAQAVVDAVEGEGDITTPTLGEFLAGRDDEPDWVIPGLIERGDRLILTGSEGLGKSVLFRQLAVGAAAGIHPFSHVAIDPQRVLYVDVENGVGQLRRALRALAIQASRHGSSAERNMFLECLPSGLDLTRPEDEAWLVSRVSALQPALLVIGPIYRLHAKNPNDEEPARNVTRVLDRCRAAANCALILEAHAGHGTSQSGERNVRPAGTSLWLRWPEFGYGLRAAQGYDPHNRVVDFVPWRGDRSEREWPKRLRSGGTWPWERAPEAVSNPYESRTA